MSGVLWDIVWEPTKLLHVCYCVICDVIRKQTIFTVTRPKDFTMNNVIWLVSVILVIYAPIKASNGLFDGLRETLSEAKKYLDDVTPYIMDGIKMVERAEQFVDSTIGEECEFVCRKGLVPRQKPGHVPDANGCGSMNVIFDDSDESYIRIEGDFTECCNEHDVCYDTCGSDKDMCDVRFKKCLYASCKKANSLMATGCKIKAKMAFMAVLGIGCQPFKDAQAEACECVKSEL